MSSFPKVHYYLSQLLPGQEQGYLYKPKNRIINDPGSRQAVKDTSCFLLPSCPEVRRVSDQAGLLA